MKFILVWLSIVLIQPCFAKEVPFKENNLLENIVKSDCIYQMTERDVWACLSGNPKWVRVPNVEFKDLLSDDQKDAPFFDTTVNFLDKMNQSGNLYLTFYQGDNWPLYFSMNLWNVKWQTVVRAEIQPEKLPELATVSQDLVWLCKHKWLLTKLSKGTLTAEDYRFSMHEFTLILRLCPKEWRGSLIKYAASQVSYSHIPDKISSIHYIKLINDSFYPSKEFLKKYPLLADVDMVKMYYPEMIKNDNALMRELIATDYLKIIAKLEQNQRLNTRDLLLSATALNNKKYNEFLFNGNRDLSLIRKYMIEQKDLELLKSYLARVERRQSIADIPVLGQFLQSDLYLKGEREFRHVILDQCSLRQEKEIVWQLADSVALSFADEKEIDDVPSGEVYVLTVKLRAKAIMMKFTKQDLGDDPKAWKKWYREQ